MNHIEINIGKACNNKCRFCMSSKSELWDIKFVSLNDLKEKISNYSENGYSSIGFLGGDISIHPNIVEIISYCKEKGYKNINIISNGMKFDDIKFTEKVINAGLTRINFSIHSHLDEVEDYLIQVPGGLQRKLKAIDNFKIFFNDGKLRDDLSVNIVVNSKNYKTIIETVLFFYFKKKVKDIRINFLWLNDDTKENWDDLKISYTDFIPYIKRLIYISLKYEIRITFDTVPACMFYKIDSINYKSLIKRFLGEDQDHITEIDHINNNEKFDWKERKRDMLKMHFDQCSDCEYNKTCQGIRKNYGQIYGGLEIFPIITNSDFSYYYNQIEIGNIDIIGNEIKRLYNNENKKYESLYAFYLMKNGDYSKSNSVYLNILNNKLDIKNEGNILFNIAVNFTSLGKNDIALEYLKKAKVLIGNDSKFKDYYDKFITNNIVYNIDDFKEIIMNYYSENDKNIQSKYCYVDNLVNNI